MKEPTFADAIAGVEEGRMSVRSFLLGLCVHFDLLGVPIPTPERMVEAVRKYDAEHGS